MSHNFVGREERQRKKKTNKKTKPKPNSTESKQQTLFCLSWATLWDPPCMFPLAGSREKMGRYLPILCKFKGSTKSTTLKASGKRNQKATLYFPPLERDWQRLTHHDYKTSDFKIAGQYLAQSYSTFSPMTWMKS